MFDVFLGSKAKMVKWGEKNEHVYYIAMIRILQSTRVFLVRILESKLETNWEILRTR